MHLQQRDSHASARQQQREYRSGGSASGDATTHCFILQNRSLSCSVGNLWSRHRSPCLASYYQGTPKPGSITFGWGKKILAPFLEGMPGDIAMHGVGSAYTMVNKSEPSMFGLVAGVGVGGGIFYYRSLVHARLARGLVPGILMVHADLRRVLDHAAARETRELATYLSGL